MRILNVEDERDILLALQRGLSKEGYVVDIADDGSAASELISLIIYDLIVLDINLPYIDGFTLLSS